MAISRSLKCLSSVFALLTILAASTHATLANIPLGSVSDLLIQKALDSLNLDSPNHNTYESGNLISAQKSSEPPDVIYRLTLNLEPKCKDGSSCPREACAIVLRQRQLGDVDVQRNSIQCMYVYPQSDQADTQQQTMQDGTRDNNSNNQEQDTRESLEKRAGNSSIQLDHEVETVTDGIDRPFIAVRAIDRKYCAGCPYELNPELPGLAAYCDQVVRSMDDDRRSEFKHKVVRIIRVTRAVPPGSNVVIYELLLEIGETNCPTVGTLPREECSLLPTVPIKSCLVTFEQRPWQQDSRKIVRNNCTQPPDSLNEVAGNAAEALDTSDDAGTTSSKVDCEPNARFDAERETAKHAADEEHSRIGSVDEVLDGFETTPTASSMVQEDTRRTVTEETAKKVVVEGNNDQVKVEGFKDKYREFDDFLKAIDFDVATGHREAEPVDGRTPVNEEIIRPIVVRPNCGDGNVSGGECDQNRQMDKRTRRSIVDETKDEKEFAYKLAQKVVDELDDIDGDDEKRVLLDVIDARKQPSDDTIYFLKIRVARSNCPEGAKNCAGGTRGSVKICKAQVQTRDSISHETAKVMQSQCYDEPKNRDERSTRQLLGGPTARKVDDPEIVDYANRAFRKFSENYAGDDELILMEIVEATTQIVSGVKHRIRVRLGKCPKGKKEQCLSGSSAEVNDYLVTVWSQPWLDHGKPDVKIKLYSEKNKVSKRSLRGKNYSQKMLKLSKTFEAEGAFEDFVKSHRKAYASDAERDYRFGVFRKNMKVIESLSDAERGTALYGATMFADLTQNEFRARHLGLRRDLRSENAIPLPMAAIPDIELPREFDWRHRNVVTEVKNQGSCGSCWAFSVTGNVESLYAIKHGKLLSLSEQELVDCDKLDSGCNGGLPDNAYRAIEEIGGLELETDYPYDGEDEKCHFDKNKARVNVVSGLNITSNETQMAQWLVANGPISIGINANAMQFYMGGISHPFKFLCNSDNLDHGVLIVGFGIHKYPIFKKEMPYWIIKNSWGPSWGEQGYYRVYRGDGTCGVNKMATSAVIA